MSQTKAELSEKVKEVFEEHHSRYGAIRTSKELQSQGIRIGRQQTQTIDYDKETKFSGNST
ncbi:hypothetical protein GCM10027035_22850 [Emticicia sediminis]